MNLTTSLVSNLDRLSEVVHQAAQDAAQAGAQATAEAAQASIQAEAGSGARGRGLPDRPSSPGEAPADQTGELAASIELSTDDVPSGVIGVDIVVGAPHGAYLELGTSKMAPRPFLGPATEAGVDAMEAVIEQVPARLQGTSA